MERVNGNAFAQIPVALWYCHQATGDSLQKQRYETFFERWRTEGWGPGAGLSRSGDAQEHFAHDMHYGSYILDNWRGGIWVKQGILDDTDDPRFAEVLERIRELYSYLYCRDANGRAVPANPWSSRTHPSASSGEKNWALDGRTWKGEPGPDFTVSVNAGNEWFAARRPTYYALTFHGRLAPAWMSSIFYGQLGFGAGALCQLTVPGSGPVLASTLQESYGKGMHPSHWRDFHIHSVVGEMWDGQPLVTAISEHQDARLNGNVVTSSGEVRDRPVRTSRRYTYHSDRIECEVSLGASEYGPLMSLWSPGRKWAEIRLAYEMIPYLPTNPTQDAAVTVRPDGVPLTANPVSATNVRIDRGGYGVDIQLGQAHNVLRGNNHTVLIELTTSEIPADKLNLTYQIVPFQKAP